MLPVKSQVELVRGLLRRQESNARVERPVGRAGVPQNPDARRRVIEEEEELSRRHNRRNGDDREKDRALDREDHSVRVLLPRAPLKPVLPQEMESSRNLWTA